jgi:hypothetical protein
VGAKIRAGPIFKRFLCLVLIDVICFRVSNKMSSRTLGGTDTPG